jgi:CDP-6-deoxy-D-xylo-4-hexulose-3-dehydrase
MFESMTREQAAEQILSGVREYCRTFMQRPPYKPGDRIPYAARVFDESEVANLADSALEFWLTAGRYADRFEAGLAEYLRVPFCSLVNSGSSANLLAFMALTSPLLGERAVKRGDEVITVAAAFPTTVAPIVQFGAVPVFVDVAIPQYNINAALLENALSPKTKAVMLAHTLGNPFDLAAVKNFCDAHGLWLIEDNCDALGSTCTIGGETKFTGTVGDIGTSSFYPPHHLTMGEGGAVYASDPLLHRIVRSLRDWGRDCACPPGADNLCGHRFARRYGGLPPGYDHKYVYSHLGYNLKATDMQAAVGCAQLEKFPAFAAARRHNWRRLRDGLKDLTDKFILPEAAPNSDPCWFGFLITCREGVSRNNLVQHIESNNIQTRFLFAGNLVKHPCFNGLRGDGTDYRVSGALDATDRVMNDTFWVGVYPGLSDAMVDRMLEVIRGAVATQAG